MPKKERKIVCPRCHRTLTESEFARHLLTHAGKRVPPLTKQLGYPKRVPEADTDVFGNENMPREMESFEREDKDQPATVNSIACSVCSKPSIVRLPCQDLLLCPTCSLGFFESKSFFGSRLINHMGPEYEKILSEKVKILLSSLGVGSLIEFGINVVLIEFSQGMNQFQHMASSNGELIFMFAKTERAREREKVVFEKVINHEIFHFYVSNILKLSITEKLAKPFTFVELFAAQLAEDIQLEKIAVDKDMKFLIKDEVERTQAFYENQSLPPKSFWNRLPDERKLQSSTSVSWTYAEESWLLEIFRETELRQKIENNLRLIQPHYSLHGHEKTKEAILDLFHGKIASTPEDAKLAHERLVKAFRSYTEANNLDLH